MAANRRSHRSAAGLAIAVVLSGVSQCWCTPRKVLKVCTAGDYPPLTFYRADSDEYSGFAPIVVRNFALSHNYSVEFVRTPWPKLQEYLSNGLCFLAAGGISRTPERAGLFTTSTKVLDDRKVPIFTKSNAARFKSLADIDAEDVVIIENRGGTNEAFARMMHSSHLLRPTLQVLDANEEVFACLDVHTEQPLVMFTDLIEVQYRTSYNSLLSDAGLDFTIPESIDPKRETVYLAQDTAAGRALMQEVDAFLAVVKADGQFDTWKHEAFAAKYRVDDVECPIKSI